MSLFSLHRSIPLPFNTKSESQYHHLSFSITFLYSSSLCSSGICTPPENASLSPLQSNLNPILASLSISSHMKVAFGGVDPVSQPPCQPDRSNEQTGTSNALALPGPKGSKSTQKGVTENALFIGPTLHPKDKLDGGGGSKSGGSLASGTLVLEWRRSKLRCVTGRQRVSVVFSLLLAARVGFDRGVSVSDPAVPDADSVYVWWFLVGLRTVSTPLVFPVCYGISVRSVDLMLLCSSLCSLVVSGGSAWFHGVALLVTGSVLSSPPDGCASFEGHFSRGGVPDLSHCGGGLKGCIRSRVWGMEAAIFGLVLNDDIAGCRLFLDFLEAVGPGTLRYEGAFLSGSRQLGARSAHVFA
ncbi:hypothetical protein F2Q69_00056829 [Brassica cretica]|uniref:Uncharacterized protein n=1 Tax=Brassica cretica TaxID=69181 RepID=A0A8S9MQ77_BRACR|nr:hypothetical protein F2Q69_00056829 [Brassica cretica]